MKPKTTLIAALKTLPDRSSQFHERLTAKQRAEFSEFVKAFKAGAFATKYKSKIVEMARDLWAVNISETAFWAQVEKEHRRQCDAEKN